MRTHEAVFVRIKGEIWKYFGAILFVTLLIIAIASWTLFLFGVNIEGKQWCLVSYGDKNAPQDVLPERFITAQFLDGKVKGSTGCNNYFASYKIDMGTIKIGAISVTEKYCFPDDVMQQERVFLSALESTESFKIWNETLEIKYQNGTLVFTAC